MAHSHGKVWQRKGDITSVSNSLGEVLPRKSFKDEWPLNIFSLHGESIEFIFKGGAMSPFGWCVCACVIGRGEQERIHLESFRIIASS